MTGSPTFFSNVRNRRNTSNWNYDMSIMKCTLCPLISLKRSKTCFFIEYLYERVCSIVVRSWHPRRDILTIIEWFSNTTETSFDDGARSKNTRKELGRLRRRVLTESWFSKEVQGECPCSGTIYSLFFHFSEAVICCYLITSQVKKAKFKWKTPTLLVCYQSTASEK